MKNILNKFVTSNKGSIVPTIAVASLVLFGVAGMALDYSRIVHDRHNGQNALDSAVLAAATKLQEGATKQEAEKIANEFLLSNLKIAENRIRDFTVTANQVSARMDATTPVTLMGLLGYKTMDWSVQSEVNFNKQESYEFALVLDISSSMAVGGDMEILKDGVNEFAKLVYTDPAASVSVSLLPYANSLAFPEPYSSWLDPYDGYSLTQAFAGCFMDEPVDQQASTSTIGPHRYIAAPQRESFNKTLNKIVNYCPGKETTATLFATSLDEVVDANNGIKSYQGTNTANGISWGWRALSPDWRGQFIGTDRKFPQDFSSSVTKTMIIFSDGLANNAPWDDKDKNILAQQEEGINRMNEVCNAIRKEGKIDVYSIGYGNDLDSLAAKSLKDCASGNGQYFEATRNNLGKVFSAIFQHNRKLALSR